MKLIVVSKATVMINAVSKPEYFLPIFKAGTLLLGVSPHHCYISYLFLVTSPPSFWIKACLSRLKYKEPPSSEVGTWGAGLTRLRGRLAGRRP